MVDLAVLCETVIDDAADRGADARYDGPDHLEVRVRRLSIKRAMTNLVENALHYGSVVTLTLAREAAGVVIRVADNGPGIPDDKLHEVLEPFVRLDPARGRDTVGFGLGLSIVAKAVADEGGTLTLSNRHEGGLEACILLPDIQ
jgi:signal transduction histidine kinase